MTPIQQAVETALKERAPAMHADLMARGEVRRYVADLANQISSEALSTTMQQRSAQKWDDLGPVESAKRMKMAQALNLEDALASNLEFPSDETSSRKAD